MTTKTNEEHLREATAALRPLMEQAEALPGVVDVMALMERFDQANQGAATYATVVEHSVFFTATNTAHR